MAAGAAVGVAVATASFVRVVRFLVDEAAASGEAEGLTEAISSFFVRFLVDEAVASGEAAGLAAAFSSFFTRVRRLAGEADAVASGEAVGEAEAVASDFLCERCLAGEAEAPGEAEGDGSCPNATDVSATARAATRRAGFIGAQGNDRRPARSMSIICHCVDRRRHHSRLFAANPGDCDLSPCVVLLGDKSATDSLCLEGPAVSKAPLAQLAEQVTLKLGSPGACQRALQN